MNYIELISKFWTINEKKSIGASAIALYLFLLEEYRKNGSGDFSMSDSMISLKLSLTRPTIVTLKSKLRNIGLIQYQTQNGLPCIYRIITDFSFLQESTKIEPIRNNAEISKQKEPTSIVQPVAKKVEKETRIAPTESIESVRENIVIPTLEEFMKFAKTLEIYDESMDFAIKSKYESWVGWMEEWTRNVYQ